MFKVSALLESLWVFRLFGALRVYVRVGGLSGLSTFRVCGLGFQVFDAQ